MLYQRKSEQKGTNTDGISSDFPQQVSTWEEYYSYLHTRYQQGTLGKDSIGLMQIAQNNSGRIVENQQHHAPIVVGLSLSKKLNERWSLETGLQYTLLRSEFTGITNVSPVMPRQACRWISP